MSAIGDYVHYTKQGYVDYGIKFPHKGEKGTHRGIEFFKTHRQYLYTQISKYPDQASLDKLSKEYNSNTKKELELLKDIFSHHSSGTGVIDKNERIEAFLKGFVTRDKVEEAVMAEATISLDGEGYPVVKYKQSNKNIQVKTGVYSLKKPTGAYIHISTMKNQLEALLGKINRNFPDDNEYEELKEKIQQECIKWAGWEALGKDMGDLTDSLKHYSGSGLNISEKQTVATGEELDNYIKKINSWTSFLNSEEEINIQLRSALGEFLGASLASGLASQFSTDLHYLHRVLFMQGKASLPGDAFAHIAFDVTKTDILQSIQAIKKIADRETSKNEKQERITYNNNKEYFLFGAKQHDSQVSYDVKQKTDIVFTVKDGATYNISLKTTDKLPTPNDRLKNYIPTFSLQDTSLLVYLIGLNNNSLATHYLNILAKHDDEEKENSKFNEIRDTGLRVLKLAIAYSALTGSNQPRIGDKRANVFAVTEAYNNQTHFYSIRSILEAGIFSNFKSNVIVSLPTLKNDWEGTKTNSGVRAYQRAASVVAEARLKTIDAAISKIWLGGAIAPH